jgi:hypothetical protein
LSSWSIEVNSSSLHKYANLNRPVSMADWITK